MGKKKHKHGVGGGESETMIEILENQVKDVKGTMSMNIEKMHEREGKLEDMESRANILAEQTTSEFKKLAVKTRQKVQKKSRRIYFILCTIIAVCVILIIIILSVHFGGS